MTSTRFCCTPHQVLLDSVAVSPPATVEPLRWGVLGVADIAVRKVIPAMRASSLSPVVAIASRSRERATEAAEQLSVPRAFGSYTELLAAPDVDAVYIPLPNHLHLEWTLAAASAGKHVLCEKPLALTSAEARRMIEHCARSGVALMEAFMYRLHPMWRAVVGLVNGGRIGELRAIQTVFAYRNEDPTNIRNDATKGGGALLDIGCYAIDLARMLFAGEPTAVHGAVRRDARFGTDALTSAVLDFDGRHATFVCSTQAEPAQRVELLGSAGRIVIEIPFNIPPQLPTRVLVVAGGEPPVSPHTEVIEIAPADPYTVQADAFATAVRCGEPVPIDPANAVANLEVIEALVASAL